jgi:hypothetical protein
LLINFSSFTQNSESFKILSQFSNISLFDSRGLAYIENNGQHKLQWFGPDLLEKGLNILNTKYPPYKRRSFSCFYLNLLHIVQTQTTTNYLSYWERNFNSILKFQGTINILYVHVQPREVQKTSFKFILSQPAASRVRFLPEDLVSWLDLKLCIQLFQYTLAIITSQLHCFQLRTILNGKDFKFFSHGLCTKKQNNLLQHVHGK